MPKPARRWIILMTAGLAAATALGQPGSGQGGKAAPATQGPAARPTDRAPSATQTVFSDLALDKALADSIRTGRLLVVIVSPDPSKQRANLAAWNNAGLAAWAARYATVVHVTDQPTIRQMTAGALKPGGPEQPLIFKSGKQERLFGSDRKNNQSRLRPAPAASKTAAKPKADEPNSSVRLLLRLEWTRRALLREDPVWRKLQEALPGSTRPASELFFGKDEAGVAAVPDLGADGDLLARLGEAREAARTAQANIDPQALRRAIGLYTWLWERGESVDPAFAPVRLYSLTAEMRTLAERSPAALARFKAIHAAALPSVAAMTRSELAAWLMLSRVIDEHLVPFDLLDSSLDDIDSAVLWPRADKLAWELLLPRLAWMNPLELPSTSSDAAGFVDRFVKRATGPTKTPKLSDDDQRSLTQTLRTQALHEACRIYAALLVAGRDDDAGKVAASAAALMRSGAPGDERLWLVTSALAAGQARPEHAAWLKDRAEPAAQRLLKHVETTLRPPPP